ncbi:M48 family metallopeptidase [Mobiluncus mulieris]|uniref:M48 family metallopeptidase n=1 Tax=Mobiluncus mulieris TaxID=2052 RepID=UPI00242C8B17|nr:SprT family zinc-dependent metalloprotease [Mobiluncus mulieris]
MPRKQQTEDIGVYHLGETPVRLQRKNVRHLRLRVTDRGDFFLSIPRRAPLATAREFLEEQRDWVENQRHRLRAKHANAPRFETGEEIAWWGRGLRLEVEEVPSPGARNSCGAEIRGQVLFLRVAPNATLAQRQRLVDCLRRESLETRLAALLPRWAGKFGITNVGRVRIRRMKTRWGSCNPRTRALTFNLELSTLDPKFLEYVVAHELAHYFHSGHGADFHALLEARLPGERELYRRLNANKVGF